MKKQLLILGLALFTGFSFAQNAYRDSLKTVYKNHTLSDSARLGALFELTKFPNNPDTVWYYIGLLKAEAIKKREALWLARVHWSEGYAYESEAKYTKAIRAYNRAKPLYERSPLKRGSYLCLTEIYGIYTKIGQADSSVFYYQLLDSIYKALPKREYEDKYWLCQNLAENTLANEKELKLEWQLEGLKSLEKFGTDRQLMKANDGIGYLMLQLGYDEQLNYTKEALRLASKLEDKQQIALQNSRLSEYYKKAGDMAQAITYQLRAFEVKTSIGDPNEKLWAFYDLSVFYFDNALYAKGLETANELLLEAAQVDNKYMMMGTHQLIGAIYEEVVEDYEKALKHYKEATALSLLFTDTNNYGFALVNEGGVYMYLEQYEDAEHALLKSLEIARRSEYPNLQAYTLLRFGELREKQQLNQEALSLYKEALKITNTHIDWDKILQINLNAHIGNSYLLQDQFADALSYCQSAHQLALKENYLEGKRNSCSCLYSIYNGMGDESKALRFLQELTLFNDTINAREAGNKIQRMEFMKQMYNDSLAAFENEHQLQLAHQEEIHNEQQKRNRAYAGLGLALLLAGGFYSRWRYVNKTKRIIEKEKERSENLLLNILPAEVAEELKEKGESDARDFDDITVLFTDFQGFTKTAAGLSAKELVGEINACFKEFDIITEKYGIEKIKTIGDAYMAAGGLNTPRNSEPRDVVKAALEMQAFILSREAKLKPQNLPYFNMRAGIHTGPVVAGIVGVKKFQYDIWGDTVNTASRIESSGEVGKVNISQATYELLKDDPDFAFESRGKIEAKGKGEMEMWFVYKN